MKGHIQTWFVRAIVRDQVIKMIDKFQHTTPVHKLRDVKKPSKA